MYILSTQHVPKTWFHSSEKERTENASNLTKFFATRIVPFSSSSLSFQSWNGFKNFCIYEYLDFSCKKLLRLVLLILLILIALAELILIALALPEELFDSRRLRT